MSTDKVSDFLRTTSELLLDTDDVSVVDMTQHLCECCSNGSRPLATKTVLIDLRSAGMTIPVGNFCEACAEEVATSVRQGFLTRKEMDEQNI
jgi:hypothetical protein